MSKRRTSVQIASDIKPKQKKKSKKVKTEGIIAAIKRANIAIEEWADSPGLIPVGTAEKLKKGKGPVGRTYRGYKRAQKAEGEYAERLEKGTKAHDKKVARMNKLVKML